VPGAQPQQPQPPPATPPRLLHKRQSIANYRPLYSFYIPDNHFSSTASIDIPRRGGRSAWDELLFSTSLPAHGAPQQGSPEHL
jgi:hypothetical protein